MKYLVTTLVLVVLTVVNVAQAQLNLGPFNTALGLGIATIEVLIMAIMFMRVRSSPAMTRLVAIAGLFWLGILMTGTLDDVLTRNWLPIPGK